MPIPSPGRGGDSVATGPFYGNLRMYWTGVTGTRYELTDDQGGVFLYNEGIRGLAMPPVDRFTSESPVQAGSNYRGSRVKARECFWPLYLYSDGGSDEWMKVDQDFWATMRPDLTGEWEVLTPNGQRRFLTCRYADDSDATFTRDPFFFGWQVYGVRLIADRPFWRGKRVTRKWTAPTNTDFYSGPNVFNIAPNDTFDTATMTNPGDEPARMIWTIYGPCDSAVVGLPDAEINVPAIAGDKKLTIDTRPDFLSAVERDRTDDLNATDGVDRTDELGESLFQDIPSGQEVTLSMSTVGADTNTFITGEIEPLYWRAW
jgi:hypothetical protein